MSAIAAGWAEAMLNATLQAGLLALAVLALASLARRASAALRAALLTVALIKFAIPPGLGLALAPGRPLPLLHALVPEVDASRAGWLFAFWALGSLFVLGRVVAESRRLAAILRAGGATPPDRALVEWIAELAGRAGLGALPRIVVSPLATEPFVCGVFRACLVLPRGWDARLSRPELESILLHELAHVRRRDHLAIGMASWLAVVWWWNPLFWAVLSRLRSAQEEASDDAAVVAGRIDRGDYCGVLLQAAKLARRPLAAPLLEPAGLGLHALERRMVRLMDPSTRLSTGLGALGLAAVLAFAAWTLPSPGLDRRRTFGSAHDHAPGHAHPSHGSLHRHNHHH